MKNLVPGWGCTPEEYEKIKDSFSKNPSFIKMLNEMINTPIFRIKKNDNGIDVIMNKSPKEILHEKI